MNKTLKILVVDDEDFYLKLFYEGLTGAGFDVITSDDGADAYEKYIAHQPDMVITDIFMKNNGIELLTNIKLVGKNVPVVTISGGIGTDNGTTALSVSDTLGADYNFKKPIQIGDIIQVIRNHFG